jgi:hypothetical protein
MILTASCASVSSNVYVPAEIKAVKVWLLEFAYETGSVEQLQKSSGDSEVKVVSKGQLPEDLQLRDDLYYILKDEYSIPLTEISSEASGRIKIHPLHFFTGGFKILTVTLVDEQGKTLARLKIENGDRRITFMDDDAFASYAANAIAKAIQEEQETE